VKPGARIPSLLRELADAFDELLAERKTVRRARTAEAPTHPKDQPTVDTVRRRLRRQGVAA
jgi:hypothetical protein